MATFTYDDRDSPLPTRIATDRLTLDRFDVLDSDLREVHDRLTSEGVRAAMSVPPYPNDPVETMADTRAKLDRYRDSEEGGFYRIGVDGEPFVGAAKFAPEWKTRAVEFGAWVDREHWGSGYAPESATAFLELAFRELDLEVLYVRTSTRNENARRAAERFLVDRGGRRDGTLRNDRYNPSDDHVEDVVRYSITADEWRADA